MESSHLNGSADGHMQGHFLNLYAMALADLTLDPEELRLLFDFGERRGINREEIESVLLNPHRVEVSIPTTILERVRCLYEFALMVWSDGRVDPSEKELMQRFCLTFQFEKENVEDLTEFLLEEAGAGRPADEVLSVVRQNLEA